MRIGAKSTNRLTRRLALGTALLFATFLTLHVSPEGERVWFNFNKAFINANYDSGEALGTVRAQTWGAAKTVHGTKCGGNDGEQHIGAKGRWTRPARVSNINLRQSAWRFRARGTVLIS
jgi:hypothetical protein